MRKICFCFLFTKFSVSVGCKVFAYDHTIKSLPKSENSGRINWKPVGLGLENSGKLKTLGTLIAENGDTNRTIQYLKVSLFKEFYLQLIFTSTFYIFSFNTIWHLLLSTFDFLLSNQSYDVSLNKSSH